MKTNSTPRAFRLTLVSNGRLAPIGGKAPAVETEDRTVRGTKADAMAAAQKWAGEGAKWIPGAPSCYSGARGAVYIYDVTAREQAARAAERAARHERPLPGDVAAARGEVLSPGMTQSDWYRIRRG